FYPNLSANGWGEPDERGQAVRDLNRDVNFRRGVSRAIDREQLGQALVRGPSTTPYPGGIFAETAFYDRESTVYFPYDPEAAKADLAAAGLEDTDGNGFLNFPDGGGDAEIVLIINGDYQTDRTIGETIVAMLERVGLRVIPSVLDGTTWDQQGLA